MPHQCRIHAAIDAALMQHSAIDSLRSHDYRSLLAAIGRKCLLIAQQMLNAIRSVSGSVVMVQ
jgi:hypothetical protein